MAEITKINIKGVDYDIGGSAPSVEKEHIAITVEVPQNADSNSLFYAYAEKPDNVGSVSFKQRYNTDSGIATWPITLRIARLIDLGEEAGYPGIIFDCELVQDTFFLGGKSERETDSRGFIPVRSEHKIKYSLLWASQEASSIMGQEITSGFYLGSKAYVYYYPNNP